MEELLTISEAARLMGVCDNTLRDWDIEKKFVAIRTMGNHRRYTLDQIREYLKEHEYIKESSCQTVNDYIGYWRKKGWLQDDMSQSDSLILAGLLENTKCLAESAIESIFSTDQMLWLVLQAWLGSKLRKLVSVQVMNGPAAMICYQESINGNMKVDSKAVAAFTKKYGFSIFAETDFESVRKLYAGAMSNELDYIILTSLYKKYKINHITETINFDEMDIDCDYIVSTESNIEKLKEHKNLSKKELITIPTILDPENYEIMSLAGKYPKKFELPIFAPYMLLSLTPMILPACVHGMLLRYGWLE